MSQEKNECLRNRVLNLTIAEFFSEEFLLGVLNTHNPRGESHERHVKRLREKMRSQLGGAPNMKLKDFLENTRTNKYGYRIKWIGNERTVTHRVFVQVLEQFDLGPLWGKVPPPPDTETQSILKEYKQLKSK